jgi:hypothetical protein
LTRNNNNNHMTFIQLNGCFYNYIYTTKQTQHNNIINVFLDTTTPSKQIISFSDHLSCQRSNHGMSEKRSRQQVLQAIVRI